MSATVKIESDCRSSVISQETLDGGAGVEEVGSTAVLPNEQRPASLRSVDDNRRTAREDEAGDAIDVDALSALRSSPDVSSRALAKEQEDASMLLSVSSAMQSTKGTINVNETVIGDVQPSTPAPSAAKKSASNSKSVSATPTRESSRIRAQASRELVPHSPSANSVTLDTVLANKIIGASLNDAFGTLYKCPLYMKELCGLVKNISFKDAVKESAETLPITKAQLKRITADNNVTVNGMLAKSLSPQLVTATKGITEATTTMDLAVETLKAAIATETPVEARSSGRKAKGKKGEKAASLGPSGEEDALLTDRDIAQLVVVFNNTAKGSIKDTLSEGVWPHFAALAQDVAGAIKASASTTRGSATEEQHSVMGVLCTMQKTLADVTVSLAEVKTQGIENAKALRLLHQAIDTSNDSRHDLRRRASSSSATASRMTGKRVPPSSSYDPSASDNSEESRTPEIKRNKKRPTSFSTSSTPFSGGPESADIQRKLQTLIDRQGQQNRRNPEQDNDGNIARQVCSLLANSQLQSQQPQVIITQPTHPPQHQVVGLAHPSVLQGGLGLSSVQQPTSYPSYSNHFR